MYVFMRCKPTNLPLCVTSTLESLADAIKGSQGCELTWRATVLGLLVHSSLLRLLHMSPPPFRTRVATDNSAWKHGRRALYITWQQLCYRVTVFYLWLLLFFIYSSACCLLYDWCYIRDRYQDFRTRTTQLHFILVDMSGLYPVISNIYSAVTKTFCLQTVFMFSILLSHY